VTTTIQLLPPAVKKAFDDKLISVPVPAMIHNVAASRRTMPSQSGTTLRMRQFQPLTTATVPLPDDGSRIPAQTLSAVDLDAEIQFFGTFIALHERTTLQNECPVLNEGVARLAVCFRQTEDELTRSMLLSTASSISATDGTNGDSPTDPVRSDFDTVVRALRKKDAPFISDLIQGEDRFATSPVGPAYLGMCDTNLIGHLDRVEGFKNIYQYPLTSKALPEEWGSIGNLRFLVSSIGSIEKSSSMLGRDVYNIFVTGKDGFGVINQDNYTSEFLYRPPLFHDELARVATVGWKMSYASRVLHDTWVTKFRVTLA